MVKEKIFVIDDEKDIVKIVQYHLRKEGFEVVKAYSGGSALDIIDSTNNLNLIILDIMLPGMNGLEICKKLKMNDKSKNIPIIFLTVKSDEADIIKGLKTGADDYITKPFSPKILVEKVRTVLRRSKTDVNKILAEIIKVGDIEINIPKHNVKIKGESINLTNLEFNILTLLAKNQGKVFTRDELLKNAWKGETATTDKAVDVHITWLRQKLGTAGDLIETIRGIGYRFKDTE